MERSFFQKKTDLKSSKKPLHPGTKLLIAFSFLILAFGIPLQYQAIIVIFGLLVALREKQLPFQDPYKIFFSIWLVAGFFLLVIHCIQWDGKLIFYKEGLNLAGRVFFQIGALMVSLLWLIRTVTPEHFYALLLDLHIPIKIVYVIFQTIYLVPQFGEKARGILLAQQARGFALKGIKNRLRAYILILSPLFSTMIYEIEENSAALISKGIYFPCKKTHFTEIAFSYIDLIIIVLSIGIAIFLLLLLN